MSKKVYHLIYKNHSMGNKKFRKKILNELKENPLKLCGHDMKEAKALKYLGDFLSYDLEDSIQQTVLKRIGVAKHTINEIRAVIEDSRADKIGALDLGFDIWEKALIPMILYNADSWIGISRKTLKILDNLFHSFCQKIYRVGSGCPIPNYYWQSGSIKFSILILQKKLNFVHHLANLSPCDLGRQVWDIQVENSLGLYSEVAEHLEAIGVSDLRAVNKYHWKKTVRNYTAGLNKTQLLEDIRKYKKLNHSELSEETFGRKSYLSTLSLENARMRFKISCGLVNTVRTNFKRKYEGKSLACPGCSTNDNSANSPLNLINQSQPDSQPHILVCGSYSDLKTHDFDPNDDKMVAEFFIKVVNRRIENGED